MDSVAGESADWISVRYSPVTGWVCSALMVLGFAPASGLVALGVWMFVALVPRLGQPLGQMVGIAALGVVSVTSGLATLLMFLGLSWRVSASLRAEVGLWTDAQGIHGHFGYRLAPISLSWEDVGRIEIVLANKRIPLLAIEHRDPAAWERTLPRWVRWRRRFVFRKTGVVPVLTWGESFGGPSLAALQDQLVREWLRETEGEAGQTPAAQAGASGASFS
jgi:hypothetical protein